jgi:hypothetical protein
LREQRDRNQLAEIIVTFSKMSTNRSWHFFFSFSDKIQIDIENGPVRTVPLSGVGRGTTLVSDPPMTSVLDLGPHFSRSVLRRTFRLTNCGRRHQSIIWSTEGFPLMQRTSKKKLPALQSTNGKDVKRKVIYDVCFLHRVVRLGLIRNKNIIFP